MKKTLSILAAAAVCAAALTSCNGGGKSSGGSSAAKEDSNKNLVVWSFTDELEGLINDYYKPTHPDMTVQYSLTPTLFLPAATAHRTCSLLRTHS